MIMAVAAMPSQGGPGRTVTIESSRARFASDAKAFIHKARVAAEIAKVSDNPLNMKAMKAVVDHDERLRRDVARATPP
jgi:hypothetical protein